VDDPRVRYPMLDELHQPSMVDGVEKPTDVRVEHPAHPLAHDPDCERVQRIMRAASGSKTVREAEKIRLVNRVEHLDDRTLDKLVLQRGDPEWPQTAIRFGSRSFMTMKFPHESAA